MKVTRVAYSHRLNVGKYAVLAEQARRLWLAIPGQSGVFDELLDKATYRG